MRWLVGWSSAAPGRGRYAPGSLEPVGAQLLWSDPDPLWAVGDWRPDEVRVVEADAANRLALFGCCGASDEELRLGLSAARGGAYRHLTAWPGSYTAVACVGRRLTVAADLAGARPVFHTPWDGGTAYATAALPLADLTEAQLDIGHLGALLACPDAPEALGDGTPYEGVRRVAPGHALILREGSREIASYEPASSLVVSAPPPVDPETAVARVRDALVEAVRARLAAPRHASEADLGYGGGGGAAGSGAAAGAAGGGYAGAAYGAEPFRDDPYPEGPYPEGAYRGEPYGERTYGERAFSDDAYPSGAHGHDAYVHDAYGRDTHEGSAYRDGGGYGEGAAYGHGGAYGQGAAYAEGAYGEGRAYRSPGGDGEPAPGGASHRHNGRGARGGRGGPGMDGRDPGPVPGMGPADRRAARGGPAPGVGADLSGGPASGTLALLAAGLPGMPGTVHGMLDGTEGGERLLAVTFNDLATSGGSDPSVAAELERARSIAENPRLHHVVVTGGEGALPFAELEGPLTDEPGPSLVVADRHRQRLAVGSSDHFVGYGARQVLDAHPARLADLLMDRRRRHLLRPVAALARAEDVPPGRSVLVPWTVYRAARKLARTQYRDGVTRTAERLRAGGSGRNASGRNASGRNGSGRDGAGPDDGAGGGSGAGAEAGTGKGFADLGAFGGTAGYGSEGAVGASVAALTWCRPGPAARWLTGEALAEVSARLEAAARLRPTVERPGERRARAALARQASDHRVLEQAAEIRNQRLHAPFYDNQVVRACRDLPEALRVKPGARASVLRAVLAGAGVHDLPAGWGAPSHAYQAASVRAGLRAAAGELIDLFDSPLLADAGLVEARVVRKALRAASQGEPLPLDGLADLVSTELWLRRLISRRGTCWTGSAAPRQRAVASGVLPAAQQRPAL
ncbi:asparagine synthase-related protein [Streptomyces sp. HNM0575]|uniref:asparagine synthase-related protein n=1 Tax=Streptomyces sp. HNM0575 TaxID=2716338 RepID=UPI001F0D30C4|nr:asparagine synthase-related protein [Streptomyces sp. HNM0575]